MSGVLCVLMVISYAPGFLTLCPGSAASAMAGAQVALADDALANIYNPAGLGFRSALSADAEYNPLPYVNAPSIWLASAAIPVAPRVTAGVFGWGSILGHSAQDSLGFFSHEFATGFALAGRFSSEIGAGMALKYIRGYTRHGSRLPLEGDVWLADAGLRGAWPVWVGELGLGAALQNVGPRYRWSGTSEADTVPLSARAGISYVVTMNRLAPGLVEKLFRRPADWWAEHWRLAVEYDINRILAGERNYALFGNWENQTSSLGIEVRPVPFLAFRFGHFYPGAVEYAGGWTFGLGLDLKYVKMDIADDQALFRPWHGSGVRRRLRWTLGVELDKLLNASRRAAAPVRQGQEERNGYYPEFDSDFDYRAPSDVLSRGAAVRHGRRVCRGRREQLGVFLQSGRSRRASRAQRRRRVRQRTFVGHRPLLVVRCRLPAQARAGSRLIRLRAE